MRRLAILAFAAVLALPAWGAVAAPAKSWHEVRSTADGFAIQFPGKPKFSTDPVPNAHGAVQHSWHLDISAHETYQVASVFYEGYVMPPPTPELYAKLLAGYATSSQTRLRTQRPISIGGHPAAEAIFDADHDFHRLVDVLLIENRLYIVASASSGAHETDADALKFRNSFRLLVR
ncbi:MAG: hypothetical protein ACREEL_11310 [Stellaceae bacterium]